MNARYACGVRWLLGALLLAAGGLKASSGVAALPWLPVLALEVALAGWLFSGRRPRTALGLASALFTLFALVTLGRLVAGADDCGCFGPLAVPPQITFAIDVAAGVLAFLARGGRYGPAAAALLAAGALFVVARPLAGPARDDSHPVVGKAWPPAGLVDFPEDLGRGLWVVVLYESSCPRCHGVVEDAMDQAATWNSQGRTLGVALLDAASGEAPGIDLRPPAIAGAVMRPIPYAVPAMTIVLRGGVVVGVQASRGIDWSAPPCRDWIADP